MLGFGYKSWKMAASVSAVTLIVGITVILYSHGSRNMRERITSIKNSWETGKIESDRSRIRIPLAVIFPMSFMLFSFVSFPK